MIKLADCLKIQDLATNAIDLINKLIFQPHKAYTTSSDGKTYFEFGARIGRQLQQIDRKIKNRRYAWQPFRKIQVRAKLNKIRDIYLSCWEDKIVEGWLNDCLNRLLHEWFSKNSYAYRIEDLGLDSCQAKMEKAVKRSQYFIKRDITKYFYTIDHQIILAQLAELIDPNDYLYKLIAARIQCEYLDTDGAIKKAIIGVPFGSAIACTLSNIHLTALDKEMLNFKVEYFRYADDILIMGDDPDEVVKAGEHFDAGIAKLKLALKPSATQNMSFIEHPKFTKITKFKHLGLEFSCEGAVRFAVEKQRKIINFFKRELNKRKYRIRKEKDLDRKIEIAIDGVNMMVTNRIRSAAIVDYYLKHVNDELQLKNIDRLVAELVISTVLDKPFRQKDFRTIPFKKLRKMGLTSLLHRSRLHRHGHLRVSFLSLHNELVFRRYEELRIRRRNRIDHMRMSRKIRGTKIKHEQLIHD
jgi:hypothetical protein